MDESVLGFYIILLLIGGIIALMGILIFIFKNRAGVNDIEIFSFKFRISDASLVIVVMGCLLMVIAGLNVGSSASSVQAERRVDENLNSPPAKNNTKEAAAENSNSYQADKAASEKTITHQAENMIVEQKKPQKEAIRNSPLESVYAAAEVFEITFTAGFTQHRCALLTFDDGTGKLRVKYYTDESGPVMVEQHMVYENTAYGLRMAGYNPVYPGTQRSFPDYSPDNFYFKQDENGVVSVYNIDNQGAYLEAFVRKIEDQYQKKKFLKDFNW